MTFLFTDIEGSTQMAQRLGPSFRQVVEDHNDILRKAITARGGTQVSTSGDSVFAVFTDAVDAVSAAIDSQRGLRAHTWPDGGEVLVRMGAHTGEGRLGGENYVGVDVIAAARISAAAHGGQVVVSETTHSLLAEDISGRFELRDLGVHRLKGLDDSQRLFQVLSPDLQAEFPPLASEGPPTNLPAQDSLFVGRERETSEIIDLLRHERMVTLYGPGGTGKTRLALHVANGMVQDYAGGVHLVRLNAASESAGVAPSIVEVIGASRLGDPIEAIAERLGTRPWLLVLDGFEHLIEAAAVLTSLLETCDRLTLLVTSQRLLNTRFERVYPISPLSVPEDVTLAKVRASEGVSLFLRRVATVDPAFELTAGNAADVAEIVRGVDGLPLAIELAAARVRLLGLARLREEVSHSISILSGGFAGDEQRHRSMEAAIAWSYAALDPPGQALLRRCSSFLGGFTLEAVEAVCSGEPVVEVHDAMTQLLDSSLVGSMVSAGIVRFRMLEPLRKFGSDRSEEVGESDVTARRHAEYFTALVGDAAVAMHGPHHYSAMERLSHERANLLAALEWSLVNDPDLGLGVLLDLAYNLAVVGALAEGRRLSERLLEAGGSPAARLKGLLGAGAIAYWLNEYQAAEAHYREAIELSEQLGDDALREEALYGQAFSLIWLGRPDDAETVADRIEVPGDGRTTRISRGIETMRAFADWIRGDLTSAADRFDQVIEWSRESGDEGEGMFNRMARSGLLVLWGEAEKAVPIQVGALERFSELQDEGGMVHALDWLARSAMSIDASEGVVLAAAVDSLRRRRGGFIDLRLLGMGDPRERAVEALGPSVTEEGWARGRDLTLSEAGDLAVDWAGRAGLVTRRRGVEGSGPTGS